MRLINSSDLVFYCLTLFVSGFSATAAICSAVLASFSLLNLHLVLVIFDVLAQVTFALFLRFIFLVSQSPLCSSNFSSRNVIQQVINIAIGLFKVQHGLAHRVFSFDGQVGYLQ